MEKIEKIEYIWLWNFEILDDGFGLRIFLQNSCSFFDYINYGFTISFDFWLIVINHIEYKNCTIYILKSNDGYEYNIYDIYVDINIAIEGFFVCTAKILENYSFYSSCKFLEYVLLKLELINKYFPGQFFQIFRKVILENSS